ncbi:MAG: response regulator [Desulfobacteraceae bacterium]
MGKHEVIKILILEDNPDDFFLLKEAVESSEEMVFEIIHVHRLAQAICTVQEKSVDVVILDLQVPDSIGLDTFLSFHGKFPHIPVVIMTGTKDYRIALEAVQKGAQDYLNKGESSASAIIRTIRYAIERQRLVIELKKAYDEINTLKGIVPICAQCKSIRDDKGYWNKLEAYIEKHSDASFSHSVCPECCDELYGHEQWYIEMKKEKNQHK